MESLIRKVKRIGHFVRFETRDCMLGRHRITKLLFSLSLSPRTQKEKLGVGVGTHKEKIPLSPSRVLRSGRKKNQITGDPNTYREPGTL
jgi:hypothetical protein